MHQMMPRKFLYPLLVIILLLVAIGTVTFLTQTKNLENQPANSRKTLDDYYTQAQNLKKDSLTEQETHTVTFLAVGDISLSRGIAQVIKTKQDPLYPFRGIESLLRSTDFNFGNLETPFSSSDSFNPGKTLVFNAPKPNVAGLTAYNFAVLNLANNHAFDQGLDGITATIQTLDAQGLLHMGTGNSLEQAWTPAIIEKNRIKIGFIGASYSSVNDGGKSLNNYVARIEDTERLKSQISSLKSQVDFIVVTMHAGTEYTQQPNQSQINFAHAAIDAGADIVIGAHPHWVQERELYCPTSGSSPFKGEVRWGGYSQLSDTNSLYSDCKWIYYSLGNFIFDQSWSEPTKKGLALKITLSKSKSGPPNTGAPPSSSSPNIGEARRGIIDSSNNAATLTDLQPAGGSQTPTTTVNTIEEISVYIQNNCCPVLQP